MQVFVFFADQAAAPEGAVFTISRGGIDRFTVKSSRAPLVTHLVVHLAAEPFDAGSYKTELRILGPDGQRAADTVTGTMDVALTGGRATMIVPLALNLLYGSYAAHFYLNGIRMAHCPFTVVAPPSNAPRLPFGPESDDL
jgi:hypothetical protein